MTTEHPRPDHDLAVSREAGDGDGEMHLRRYLAVLWEGRWVLLACTVVVFVTVLVSTLAQTPIYRATAQLQLDPRVPNPLSLNESAGANYSEYWINESFYNTQAKVMKSRPLAAGVITRLGLTEQAPYKGAKDPPALVMGRIEVERVPETQLINVGISGPDPAECARLANAVAEEYIQQGIAMRRRRVEDFLQWYQKQLTTLAQAVEEGDKAIIGELEKADLLIGPEGREDILEQKVSQLTADLTEAKSVRLRKEATITAIQNVRQGKGSKLALPEVQSDPAIADLNKQLIARDVELSKLLTTYREKHPEVIKARQEREQIQARLSTEADRIVAKVESEYAILKAQEENLAKSLEEQKAEARQIQRKQLGFAGRATNQEQRRAILEKLQAVSQQTALTSEFQANNTRIINEAIAPDRPVKPNVRNNMILSVLGGLMLGALIVLVLDYLDNTVRSPEHVEQYLRLHLLSFVPHAPASGSGAVKEAYHTLRTGLLFANRDRTSKAVLVTSAGPGEGKTSTALNLAQILASSGDKVVLLDCDLRRPSVHKYLNIPKEQGLTEYLAGRGELQDYLKPSSVAGLRVITSGPIPPNPPEMLDTERFLDLLPRLKRDFDWVIVDSPPVLSVTDGVILASLVDGVVLVVQHARYARDMVRRAVNQLRNVHTVILGCVLNNVNVARDAYYYNYYYAYDYSESRDRAGRHRTPGGEAGTRSPADEAKAPAELRA